jgi:hypothetical protein
MECMDSIVPQGLSNGFQANATPMWVIYRSIFAPSTYNFILNYIFTSTARPVLPTASIIHSMRS